MYRTTALLVLASLLGANIVAAEERVPLPAVSDIDKAHKLVRDLFKDDFAKTAPKAKLAMAEKLCKQADESNDDPAAQFVLLRDTVELAATGGDSDLALRAVDRIRTRFTGVTPEVAEALFKMVASKTGTPDANLALANYFLKVVDEAVLADDLDTAERVGKMAENAAAKSKNTRTAAVATARVKEIEGFKKDAPQVKAAIKALETASTDVAAAAIVGKYYCFQKGDWDKGILLLATGDDAKLRAVAEKEVANPKEAAEVIVIADGWYDLGIAAPTGAAKRAMLSRAYAFYTKAFPDLTGLSKTRTEKRMEELEKLIETRGQHDELFAAVRAAARAKDVEELNPLGGFFGKKAYRDPAPSGGVLIGFQYTTKKFNNDHDVMDYMRPIYMTPTGEKLGTGYGKVPAKPLVVKAKPGYAVGLLRVRGGGLLEGFGITFMKIQGKGLNPADRYDSPWMGRKVDGNGEREAPVGDGRAITGIHGKLRGEGDEEICSIGLIVAGPKPKKAP